MNLFRVIQNLKEESAKLRKMHWENLAKETDRKIAKILKRCRKS